MKLPKPFLSPTHDILNLEEVPRRRNLEPGQLISIYNAMKNIHPNKPKFPNVKYSNN